MPYEQNTGKWRHPGGSCGQCQSLGFVITNEKPDNMIYVWKCNCHIGEDRNLNYPRFNSKFENYTIGK